VKIFLRLESEIPPTLTKYGKIRIPAPVIPLLAGKKKTITLRYGGSSHNIKVDRYGRVTLPVNIASASKGKTKLIMEGEIENGDRKLELKFI